MHMNVGGEAAGQFCDSLLSAVSSAHFNLEKSYRSFEEEKTNYVKTLYSYMKLISLSLKVNL